MRKFIIIIFFISNLSYSQNNSILSDGVGINNSNPEAYLDVNGTIRLEHSSQGINKILIANSDGEVRWGAPFELTFIDGNLPLEGRGVTFTDTRPHYTKATITLEPGSYMLRAVLLINNAIALNYKQSFYLNAFLSDSSDSSNFSSDYLDGSAKIMGGTLIGPNTYGLIDGNVAIRNSTSSPKTYYLWVQLEEFKAAGSASATIRILDFTSKSWGENIFYAIPIE